MAEVLPAAEEEFWAWISRRKAGTGGGTALVPISSAKMPVNSLTGPQSQEIAVLAGALQEHGMSAEEAALLSVDLAEIRQNAGRDTQMLTEKEFYEAFEKGFNYDIMQEIRENYSDELKEELNSGRAREESKEEFIQRANCEGLGIYEGQTTTYGFRRGGAGSLRRGSFKTVGQSNEPAIETKRELEGLGIQADIIEVGVVFWNKNGVTRTTTVPEAATLANHHIVINSKSTIAPRETAGHEAFHLWKNGIGRDRYISILQENLLYSSTEFLTFQDEIAQTYFEGSVDISDNHAMERFQEEIFAYISGQLYSGIYDAQLRHMFRDYDAVKAAWYELIRKNR